MWSNRWVTSCCVDPYQTFSTQKYQIQMELRLNKDECICPKKHHFPNRISWLHGFSYYEVPYLINSILCTPTVIQPANTKVFPSLNKLLCIDYVFWLLLSTSINIFLILSKFAVIAVIVCENEPD